MYFLTQDNQTSFLILCDLYIGKKGHGREKEEARTLALSTKIKIFGNICDVPNDIFIILSKKKMIFL